MTVRTADKVFPKLDISIQYRIKHEDSPKSLFELEDPLRQMSSYTDNIVRRTCSGMNLDELFESQSKLADDILNEAGPKMKEGGFTLESVQVKNILPPEEILKSMNEINASERRRTAAKYDGEASKIKAVLMAEADAQEKELRGKGIAAMRTNITEGWVHSVKEMSDKAGISPQEVLQFLTKILQQ
jgi:regulator of protease activity HflC (stomatin/prohibitin superfamily)